MAESKSYSIDDVVNHCKESETNLKVFQNIIEHEDRIRLNYKMMQLYMPSIPVQGRQKIDHSLDEFEHHFNKTEIRKMMIQDGFGEWNWNDLFQRLKNISVNKD